MQRENLIRHIKRTVLVLIVILASLLQNTGGFAQQIFGISVMYIIPTVICISMFEGEIVSMLCGLLGGLLWDASSAHSHYFHALILTVLSFLTSYLIQRRIRNTVLSSLILNSAVLLIHNISYWIFYILIPGTPGALSALFKFYLPSCITTVVVGLLSYIFIRFIHRIFKSLT